MARSSSGRLPRWFIANFAAFFAAIALLLGGLPASAAPTEDAAKLGAPSSLAAPASAPRATLEIPPVPADWTTKAAEGIRFRVVPGAEVRLEPALERLSDDIAELRATFGDTKPLLKGLEVRIVREPEDIALYAPKEAPPPKYASGVAYPGLHLVIVALKAPRTFEAVNVPEVLRHELIHVALHDAVSSESRVPRWFDEGVAVHLSGERRQAREETLYRAASIGKLIPLQDLERNFPEDGLEVDAAYAESADFVRFLLRPQDRARFADLIARIEAGTPFSRALSDAYASDLRRLEFEWKKDVDARKGSAFQQAMATGSLLWGIGIIALALAWWKMRKRAKTIHEKWEREEEREATMEAMREALLRAAAEPALADGEPVPAVLPTPVPRVRHEGEWHTLH